MTLQLLIIVLVIYSVVLASVFVPWGKVFRQIYGDNPNKGIIYIDNINDYDPKKAKIKYDDGTGKADYKYKGKKESVSFDATYPAKFVNGRRIVFAEPGNTVALPFAGKENKQQFSNLALGVHTLGYIYVEGLKSLKKQGATGLITILLIVAIAAAGIFGFLYFTKKPAAATTGKTTTSLTTTTTNSGLTTIPAGGR
jgi:hypothetical protein